MAWSDHGLVFLINVPNGFTYLIFFIVVDMPFFGTGYRALKFVSHTLHHLFISFSGVVSVAAWIKSSLILLTPLRVKPLLDASKSKMHAQRMYFKGLSGIAIQCSLTSCLPCLFNLSMHDVEVKFWSGICGLCWLLKCTMCVLSSLFWLQLSSAACTVLW